MSNVVTYKKMRSKRLHGLLLFYLIIFCPSQLLAQFNIERLIMVGRNALFYEDYVLSIQYFNQVISAKPYLYEPWFYRGVAKFYLDDFVGAETDCSEAIRINPYVNSLYELRGLCRIRQSKFVDAIGDYNMAIKHDPSNQGFWYNRVLCRIQNKDYDNAHHDLDSMIVRWKKYAPSYSLKAEVFLQQKDTVQGAKWLDKSLEIDPYNGEAWSVRGIISMAGNQWKDADQQFSKAIHLKPNMVGNYINRALSRYNINNLRGAMADYDKALDLDPNNFIGHYNRALLRVQVGDENRAILDFDYILQYEPDDVMALFNRALLLDRTGNPRAAIRDYTKVIDQYPNFWTGLQYRARCYRRLGMNAQAELDEFRIFKAQMNKHLGIQPRLKKKQIRKKSDIDLEKYNQMVAEDENTVEHEYSSAYRGKVQNHKVEAEYMPMYGLDFAQYANGVSSYQAFVAEVDEFNRKSQVGRKLYVTCGQPVLTEADSKTFFEQIDTLTAKILGTTTTAEALPWLLQRAVAYTKIQNLSDAVNDLNTYLQIDSTSVIAYWQRAVCQTMLNQFHASQGMNVQLMAAKALDDFNISIRLSPNNAYFFYDRGNHYALRKEYTKAVEDYNAALKIDPKLSEAYYNRGLVRIYSNHQAEGIQDLSKAGELGIYSAYSIIKKYSGK